MEGIGIFCVNNCTYGVEMYFCCNVMYFIQKVLAPHLQTTRVDCQNNLQSGTGPRTGPTEKEDTGPLDKKLDCMTNILVKNSFLITLMGVISNVTIVSLLVVGFVMDESLKFTNSRVMISNMTVVFENFHQIKPR